MRRIGPLRGSPSDIWSTFDPTPCTGQFALRFIDTTATQLTNESFFVPDSLSGWTGAKIVLLGGPQPLASQVLGDIQTMAIVPPVPAMGRLGWAVTAAAIAVAFALATGRRLSRSRSA